MFSTIKRIFEWVGPYRGRLWLGTLCSIIATWCSAGPMILAAYYVSRMFNGEVEGVPLSVTDAWIALGAIIGFIILRYLFSYAKAYLQDCIGNDVAALHRLEVGERLKRVPMGYFEQNKTGDILSALTSELSVLELNAMKMIDRVLQGYLNTIALLAMLAFFSLPSALIALAAIFLSYLVLERINTLSERNAAVTHQSVEDMSGAALEILHGLPIIKAFGSKSFAIERFNQACANNKAINIKIVQGFVPANSLHMLILKLSVVIILIVTLWQFSMGDISTMAFFALVFYAFNLLTPIESINDASHMLGIMNNAMDRIAEIEKATSIDEGGQDIHLSFFDVAFDGASFSYGNKRAIDNVSLSIPQNSTCAIVGPSGSGKTTLCNLIARFYDVESGCITVGGYDVRDMTCDSLLSNISMVFQNVYLFNDSVRNNIRFGNPDATDDEIVEAAKKARCHDFIMDLSEGYDTMVGEGGSRLSGGEKQRVSIARAILKDAPIIILDEATASVDPENERDIQSAIGALTVGKTIITIAHRIATIEHADQIIVMDEGRIAQKGTHQVLMQEDGIYRRFVQIRHDSEHWSLAGETL